MKNYRFPSFFECMISILMIPIFLVIYIIFYVYFGVTKLLRS